MMQHNLSAHTARCAINHAYQFIKYIWFILNWSLIQDPVILDSVFLGNHFSPVICSQDEISKRPFIDQLVKVS